MTSRGTLRRYIVGTMVGVTLVGVATAFFGSLAAYAALYTYLPGWVNTETWMPTGMDWVLVSVLSLPVVAAAGAVSMKLAQRILAPISALADSARQIAEGDLSARAGTQTGSFKEIAVLVSDFNHMAESLQDNADRITAWNAAVAHEIRTPLTILKGRVQGAMDGVFPLDQKLLRDAMQQINGLSRLVDDLRLVTLADSGKLALRISKSSVSRDVLEAVDVVRPLLGQAGFTIETSLTPLEIRADTMRLQQALHALLANVERHANPGLVKISARQEGDMVAICIEDPGPGLPPQFVKRAFNPFMRADALGATDSGGSGLGLSVVRAIATAHGGRVSYDTTPAGGAAFTLFLPIKAG